MNKTKHVITIDLEDWEQSSWDISTPISERVLINTSEVLSTLSNSNIKATFFVLAKVVEKYPQVITQILKGGHEIQSHGYSHTPVFMQTPEEFRLDLIKSREIIDPLLPTPMNAYRAPDFSIGNQNMWALDILAEEGFIIDSSLFPVKTLRYGINGIPEMLFKIQLTDDKEILEIPVSIFKFCNIRFPFGGGGYFRLYPKWLINFAIKRNNDNRIPSILYFHPYEFASRETYHKMKEINHQIPFYYRVYQGLGRIKMIEVVNKLMNQYQFVTLSELCRSVESSKIVTKRF